MLRYRIPMIMNTSCLWILAPKVRPKKSIQTGLVNGHIVLAIIRIADTRGSTHDAPPSTIMLDPVIYELKPLARKPATLATSTGFPALSKPILDFLASSDCN